MHNINKTVKLEVNTQEAVFIHSVLGQLPTSSNAHPLFMKLGSQIQTQAPQAMEAINEAEEADIVTDVEG